MSLKMSTRRGWTPRARLVTAVVTVVALAVTAVGCGSESSSSASKTDGPIKVGVMLPLTGPLTFFGEPFRNAIEMRLKEAGAEVDGRKIELKIVDDASDLATAQPKAKQLVEQEKVAMVIGPLHSGVMAGLLPYFVQKQVPVVSLLNQPKEIGGSGWLFTPQGSLSDVSRPGGQFASEKLGVKTATVQAADYIAGKEVIAGFTDGFKQGGGKVVQAQFPPLGATDFGPFLARLKPADALVAWHTGSEANFMAEYFKRGALDHTLLGYGDALTESMLDELGKNAEGIQAPLTYSRALDTPASKKFVADYQQATGKQPTAQIDEGAYEAMTVAIEALKATKGNTDPKQLRDAIAALKLETPAGPVRFNAETGFGIRNIYIVEAKRQDGKMEWSPVETYENVGG